MTLAEKHPDIAFPDDCPDDVRTKLLQAKQRRNGQWRNQSKHNNGIQYYCLVDDSSTVTKWWTTDRNEESNPGAGSSLATGITR